VTSAIATLEALLADRDSWVRLRAATALLTAAVQLREVQALEDRLMALEERARELPLAAIQ
jgi:HEAT repeat protein